MALRATQRLTEMNTRNIFWGKGGRHVRLTTLPPSCAVVMKSENLNFLVPFGPLQAGNGTALPLPSVRGAINGTRRISESTAGFQMTRPALWYSQPRRATD